TSPCSPSEQASLPTASTADQKIVPVSFQIMLDEWMRYDVVRSNTDKSLHIIFVDGSFDDLPHCIRKLGPWQGLTGGEANSLRLHYQLQMAEQGFVVVYQ